MKTMVAVALATLFAAVSARGEVRVGVLAGANVANLDLNMEEPDVTLRAKTLFAAGMVVEVGLSRNLSVQLEPMYLRKGGRIEIRDFFGDDASGSLRLSYVELPVLLKLSRSAGRVRPYLMLGPSVGYRVDAKIKDEVTGEEEDADENDIEKWDLGVAVGGGLTVPVGRATVFVESRYTWGLVDLDKEDEDTKLKNRGVQVLAGVTFPVGRR
jgi:opacity protein-like surface antigen